MEWNSEGGFSGVRKFMSGTRIHHATDDGIAIVPDLTELVTQDARTNALRFVSSELRHEIGISQLSASHFDAIGGPIGDSPLGLAPIDNRSLSEHRHGHSAGPIAGGEMYRRPNFTGEIDAEAGRHMSVWTSEGDGVNRSPDDRQQVEFVGHRCGNIGPGLGDYAGPWRQLVSA